jgi:hypothetical protein
MSWRSKLAGAMILVGFFSSLASDGSVKEQTPVEDTSRAAPPLFHPDPEHLWNRLHRHLTVRTAPSGQEHGFDALDPLFWPNTQYLLTGQSHEKALQLCDEFLRVKGEQLVGDPIKRVLLQRDLWAVFDWLADPNARFYVKDVKHTHPAARAALRAKLGLMLWRLALPEEQVRALPDNYQQAITSGRFATEYDPSQREKPFLPPDLFDPRGPWVPLSLFRGPTAPEHVRVFSGRSVFVVLLRLPGGRKTTLDYLAKLWHFPSPWVLSPDALRSPCCMSVLNPDVPQFPVGTQVALVRRLVLFDADGKLIDTPVTESIQIRVYREVPAGVPFGFGAQDFFEFELGRALLLREEAGGLRPVATDGTEFRIFGGHGEDVLEEDAKSRSLQCSNCHAEPGIHSLRSVEALFPPRPLIRDPVEGEPGFGVPYLESSAALYWKETRYDWGLLNALRPISDNPPRR